MLPPACLHPRKFTTFANATKRPVDGYFWIEAGTTPDAGVTCNSVATALKLSDFMLEGVVVLRTCPLSRLFSLDLAGPVLKPTPTGCLSRPADCSSMVGQPEAHKRAGEPSMSISPKPTLGPVHLQVFKKRPQLPCPPERP